MKKSGGENLFNLQSPLVARLIIIWSVISFLLLLFLLWYVLDSRPVKLANETAPALALALPEGTEVQGRLSSGYQIELVGENSVVNDIVARVSKHIFLPRGEVKVATIIDVAALRADFPGTYTYAENGHKAVFYPNGLIIFDLAADKIVDVIRLPGQSR